MEVVLEPAPFGVGRLDQTGARCAQALGELLPLRDDGSQAQCRYRRHGDVELGTEHGMADRVEDEGSDVVGGVPYREAHRHRDRQGRALLTEAQRGPDERREDEISQRALAVQRDLVERDDRSHQ